MPQPRVSQAAGAGVPFLEEIYSTLARKLDLPIPTALSDWMLASHEIGAIWRTARSRGAGDIFSALLDALDVRIHLADGELERMPRRGPALVVANHPHGLLDGIVAGALMMRVRTDFRILANPLLSTIPNLEAYFLPIDPFGRRDEVRRNASALLSAFRFLKRGGALVVFPAGEVSCLQPGLQGVADPLWSSAPLELAARAGAPVVPLFLHGRNGAGFQVAGLIHPALRTALLGRELVNKRARQVTVAIGKRVLPESLRERAPADGARYVRERTYALGRRAPAAERAANARRAPVAPAVDPARLDAEIASLPAAALLYERGDSGVYVANAPEIPVCLDEIGRLREITFRAAGEGTGCTTDRDRFDLHYQHLFLWNRRNREIVGAYRAGNVDDILRCRGLSGFYTRTLFQCDRAFISRLAPGLELGRSFVRPEYQRRAHSLSYLWKGIGALIARTGVRYLFGPVSISADYSAVAREVIVAYFEARRDPKTGNWIRPNNPPRRLMFSPVMKVAREVHSIGELSDLIADLQGDGREMPVLLRHYMNLGGRVIGFNVDRSFSNALDALVVLDLDATDPGTLERYTGMRRQQG